MKRNWLKILEILFQKSGNIVLFVVEMTEIYPFFLLLDASNSFCFSSAVRPS